MSKLPFEQVNREILVKKQAETSTKFGCNPNERPVEQLLDHGIVNVDKPSGPTSHQVSAYVKQMLKLIFLSSLSPLLTIENDRFIVTVLTLSVSRI